MDTPRFESYGNYSSENYGSHTLVFTHNTTNIYFSYKTVVAFSTPKSGLIVSENLWGPTTGKHLNWIHPDKSKRVSREKFEKLMNKYL